MKTMTIRNIPDNVAGQLKILAEASDASMNTTVVQILASGVLPRQTPRKRRDLSRFCGGWTQKEYEEFENATSEGERIYQEDWQ